jgi:hypothetical protein
VQNQCLKGSALPAGFTFSGRGKDQLLKFCAEIE